MPPGRAPTPPARRAVLLEAAAWLALGLVCFEWWQRLTRGDIEAYVNADIIYLPTLVEDVVVRGLPYRGAWHLTPAPYLFPDGLFALLGRALSSRIEAVQVFAVLAQVVSVALAMRALLAVTNRPRALGPLLTALVFALGLLGHRPFELIALPAYHTGVAIVVLAAGALVLSPSERWPRARLVALAALCFLGAASDSLIVLWALAVGGLSAWQRWSSRWTRRAAWLDARTANRGLVAAASCVLGSLLRRLLVPFPDRGHDQLRLEKLGATLAQGWTDWTHFGALLRWTLVLGLVALVVVALRSRSPQRRFAAATSALFIALVFTAIAATGNLNDAGWSRYLLAPAVLSALSLVWCARARGLQVALALLAAAGVVTSLSPGTWRWTSLPDFHARTDIACVDALAEREGAHVVVTDYWHGKPLTALSTHGTRAAQVTEGVDDLRLWINSRAWYRPTSDVALVLVNGLDEARLSAIAGAPADVQHCGALTVNVYRGEGRARLQQHLEALVTHAIGPAR